MICAIQGHCFCLACLYTVYIGSSEKSKGESELKSKPLLVTAVFLNSVYRDLQKAHVFAPSVLVAGQSTFLLPQLGAYQELGRSNYVDCLRLPEDRTEITASSFSREASTSQPQKHGNKNRHLVSAGIKTDLAILA